MNRSTVQLLAAIGAITAGTGISPSDVGMRPACTTRPDPCGAQTPAQAERARRLAEEKRARRRRRA